MTLTTILISLYDVSVGILRERAQIQTPSSISFKKPISRITHGESALGYNLIEAWIAWCNFQGNKTFLKFYLALENKSSNTLIVPALYTISFPMKYFQYLYIFLRLTYLVKVRNHTTIRFISLYISPTKFFL